MSTRSRVVVAVLVFGFIAFLYRFPGVGPTEFLVLTALMFGWVAFAVWWVPNWQRDHRSQQ